MDSLSVMEGKQCCVCGMDEETESVLLKNPATASDFPTCFYCWGPVVINTKIAPIPVQCLWSEVDAPVWDPTWA